MESLRSLDAQDWEIGFESSAAFTKGTPILALTGFHPASLSWDTVKASFETRVALDTTRAVPAKGRRCSRSRGARLGLDGDSGLLRVGVGDARSRYTLFALARLADVDTALEEGAIFDADALCNHIPGQGAFTANVNPVAGIDVAAHLAQNDYFTGRDIR